MFGGTSGRLLRLEDAFLLRKKQEKHKQKKKRKEKQKRKEEQEKEEEEKKQRSFLFWSSPLEGRLDASSYVQRDARAPPPTLGGRFFSLERNKKSTSKKER